jgi:hypothetical protein
VLPATAAGECWETLLDTADPRMPSRHLRADDRYELQAQSMALLKLGLGRELRR